jgi:hypothetical protein
VSRDNSGWEAPGEWKRLEEGPGGGRETGYDLTGREKDRQGTEYEGREPRKERKNKRRGREAGAARWMKLKREE